MRYVPVDGEFELLPGLRLLPAPGHTRGMQVVVVETGGRPVVVGGDVAVWHGEFDEPPTEGRQRVLALDPELVWLAHEHEPWRPRRLSRREPLFEAGAGELRARVGQRGALRIGRGVRVAGLAALADLERVTSAGE